MPNLHRLPRWLIVAAVALAVAGCSRQAKVTRYLERAERFHAAGKFEQAELEYTNVLRLDRKNPAAIRTLALMAFDQGSLGRAYALLTEARKNKPDDFLVRLKLAKCLLAGGGIRQAREEAVQLLKEQPTNEEALRFLVETSVTADQLTDAAMQLEKLRLVAGKTAGHHIAWGLIQMHARELNAADDSFRKALVLDPQSSAAHVAIGNLHLMNHRRDDAKTEYKLAAELAPMRSPHRLNYIDFNLADGELAEAKRILEEIAKAAPDYMPAQIRLARLALADNRFDECERLLHRVLSRDPVYLEGALLLSRLLVARDQPAKAVTVLEGARREYPRVAGVHFQLASTYLKNNQVRDAVNSLNETLSVQPDHSDAVLLLAELNLRRGDPAAAISALGRLVSQRPDLPATYLLLATAHLGRGNHEEALGIYEKLRQAFPNNPQIPLRIGMLWRQMKRPEEARKNFEAALRIAPHYGPALEQLAGLAVAEKRFADARNRLQQEIVAQPANPLPQLLLGRVYFAEGNLLAAEDPLRKASELAPESTAPRAVLAQVYVAANRHHDALRTLQETVRRNPADVASLAQIARLHSAAANYSEARQAYERVIAINPQFAAVHNNLAWLWAEHLHDLDRAFDHASQARRQQPSDPVIADTLGWVYYHKGDYARALPLIRESVDKRGNDPEVIYHLGMTHYMMGEETAARAALLSALQPADDAKWRQVAECRLRVLDIDPATADVSAITELETLAAQTPKDAIIMVRLAAIAERRGQWPEAAAAYEKALLANPMLMRALVNLARLNATQLNNRTRAMELARQARKADAGDPTIAYLLGRLTYQSAESASDFQRAFSFLQESARKLPDDPQVLIDYAWAAYAVGQADNAVQAMRNVAVNKPAVPAIQAAEFLRFHLLLEDPKEAEVNLALVERTLRSDSGYVPALMVMGLAQERKRQFKASEETYQRVLKRFPLFVPANKRLALLYFGPARDEAKAYMNATRAREALPHDIEVARVLGFLEYDRERYSRAAQLLAQCTAAFPDDGESYYRLGIAQHKIKQTRESADALRKALLLAPSSPLATHAKLILAEAK